VASAEPKQLSEIGRSHLRGLKILAKPARLETTLSNVLNLLSSFLDMQHGTIALLDDDDVPEIVVGSVWNEDVASTGLVHLPRKALDQIVATAMPLVVQNAGKHPLYQNADIGDGGETAGASQPVSFIGVPIKIEDKVVGTLHSSGVGREKRVPVRPRRALPFHDRQSHRPDDPSS
jgi:Nif-specific regulatory protein